MEPPIPTAIRTQKTAATLQRQSSGRGPTHTRALGHNMPCHPSSPTLTTAEAARRCLAQRLRPGQSEGSSRPRSLRRRLAHSTGWGDKQVPTTDDCGEKARASSRGCVGRDRPGTSARLYQCTKLWGWAGVRVRTVVRVPRVARPKFPELLGGAATVSCGFGPFGPAITSGLGRPPLPLAQYASHLVRRVPMPTPGQDGEGPAAEPVLNSGQ